MKTDLRLGPPRVQIQTQSVCNGRCIFCPNVAVREAGIEQGRMSPELFEKIIDELADTEPRRISLYLMNEPLLDPRLPEFIHYVRERVPGATTLVTSNGSCLDENCAQGLINSGLKRVKVSIQSLDSAKNRAIMGDACDSDRIVENVLRLRRMITEQRVKHLDVRVSTIITTRNEDEIPEARRFWKRHGIRLVTSALENRGGNIQDAGDLNPHAMAPMGHDCIRPSREMCVLFNGDVVLCCVDWFRTVVVGNLNEQSIREVWNGQRLKEVRRALRMDDHDAMPCICVNCSESARPDDHRRGLRGLLSRGFTRRPKKT